MIPDFFQELTGWRKFGLRDQGRLLVSANHPIPWTTTDPGPAVCIADSAHSPSEPCPSQGCTCGYYAYKGREDAEQHGQGLVLARVLLWGRIVEHARGYRAERLKLAEVFAPIGTDLSALSARYRIPVTAWKGPSWTSENPYAPSSSNQSQNQWQNQLQNINLQNYQSASQVWRLQAIAQQKSLAIEKQEIDDAILQQLRALSRVNRAVSPPPQTAASRWFKAFELFKWEGQVMGMYDAPSDRDYASENARVTPQWPERTCATCHAEFRMQTGDPYQVIVICPMCEWKSRPREKQ